MSNQYTGITEYYDLWTTSGYYQYQAIAEEIAAAIPKGLDILELGVGTGLLVEEYLKLDPNCKFTGVDFTPSLLEIAKQRLGEQAELIQADAVTMDLNQTFDIAISNGGVWGILDQGERWQFGGHVPGLEANRQGLENLNRHLKEGGLLLLHLQKPHQNFDQTLAGGVTYSQSLETIEETEEQSVIEKTYFFKKGEELVASEKITITCFNPEISKTLLEEAGFVFKTETAGGRFAIYQKKGI